MKFSIIIPVYNVKAYLIKCLESVKSQSFEDYEVILIDDGSTDGSGGICDEYAKDSPSNWTVLHEKNGGQSFARNQGIKCAKGEYLIFLDGDDYLSHSDCLQKINAVTNGVDIISYGWKEVPDGNDVENYGICGELSKLNAQYDSGEGYLKDALQYRHLYEWYVWRYAFRLDFWKSIGAKFKEGIKYEDIDLVYTVILKAKTIYVLNDLIYVYRTGRPGSTVTKVSIRTEIDSLNVAAKNIHDVENNVNDKVVKKLLQNNFSCQYYAVLIQSSRLQDKERTQLWHELEKKKWICKYTIEFKQRIAKKSIALIGIPATSKLLGLRYKIRKKVRKHV